MFIETVLVVEGMGNLCGCVSVWRKKKILSWIWKGWVICVCVYVCKEKAYCIDLGGENIGYIM